MARVQRVFDATDGSRWYTVVSADHLPIAPISEYIRFLRDDQASPHTVRAYAAGLAAWWTLLEHTDTEWTQISTSLFGSFLTYLRTGDLPNTSRVGPPEAWLAPATVQQRGAAVLAFYRYHAHAHHLDVPYQKLYGSLGKRGRSRYVPMLAGVARGRRQDRPIYRVRGTSARRTPILLPAQVQLILDTCAAQGADGQWSGTQAALRDRLLFATLAETGMRLGEALSLRHNDFHIGAGGTPWIDVATRQDHPHGVRVKGQPRRIYVGDDLEALYSAYVWQLVDAGADLSVPGLDTHFVFVNRAGGTPFAALRPETVYSKVRSLNTAAKGLLPQGWSPHWLRHTHATALLASGVPVHVVMRRLGHLDIQTTLSTYGWVTEDIQMRTAAQWKNYAAGWKGLHDDTH
ncbi:Putative transposase/phage integrase [Mycobacteroides abscessus subsp. abscessus]|uniref:tyrosine-type recombinase/integrase n=1 Tax=Mycobacteroides abscessus TaxID=36809 RepID=UPI000928FC14|nr:tyrosine-type recombinase/integrase [Mycobacteroides abscessus]MDO3104585.1 tyrosine-type recombinase/integrase [Mycobacteroides abscessus subsp. abscessus]SIJ39761.1 Putative transposase/phage integrase [Mycobacteroides abscessus subsp. abscessus]SIN46101.1 Putative transposase/phage integrase [Mycobacteroides abscessus subsp. abscessus]SKF50599.1 Putative transposase/phage integrase [Mycobacteroides abscessus subsp. abscessus]SLG56008.1 Putative transposase/phage integrase [Mycobacteroide